jgi:hypothetical protein
MKKRIALLVVSLVLLSQCSKEVYNPDICFQENILPIFISNCTMSNCHNSSEKEAGYDLSNYDGIMKGIKAKHPLLSEIYNTIKGNNPSMPRSPYPKLSTRDVTFIKLWINMGAPNTSNCSNCDTTKYTFSGSVKKTIDLWCIGCHTTNNSSGGFDLSNYQGVVNAIANNKLIGSIKHLSGYSPMPKNTAALSNCAIQSIQKWIDAGHLNN